MVAATSNVVTVYVHIKEDTIGHRDTIFNGEFFAVIKTDYIPIKIMGHKKSA
jgi:hypothetical protein